MTMLIKDHKPLMSVAQYMTNLSKMEVEQITYLRLDALKAAGAMPDGKNAEFYRLEAQLCSVELRARLQGVTLN